MSNKPTEIVYVLAARLGELEQRVKALEAQAMFVHAAEKPKRGRPRKAKVSLDEKTPAWAE